METGEEGYRKKELQEGRHPKRGGESSSRMISIFHKMGKHIEVLRYTKREMWSLAPVPCTKSMQQE